MDANYIRIEDYILASEGGYCNDVGDPGGPTNWGITIIDARKYWKANATAADVRAMPKSVAQDIYKKRYWAPMRCGALPAGLDYTIMDYGVNSGITRSGKVLRRLLGMSDSTWEVTDEVLAAVAKRNPRQLITAIDDERISFLRQLRTWPTFGKGWGRRVASVKQTSLNMAGANVAVSVPAPPGAGEAPGKGHVPAAPKGGPIVVGGAVGAGAGFFHQHPVVATGLIVVGVAVAVGGVMYAEYRRQVAQHAATPGVLVVPEITK